MVLARPNWFRRPHRHDDSANATVVSPEESEHIYVLIVIFVLAMFAFFIAVTSVKKCCTMCSSDVKCLVR